MDTCTNCGVTLRPGARFCTTCGTRLNETPAANDGWGTPRTDSSSDAQETSVLQAVQPEQSPGEATQADPWSGSFRRSSDDPASRFISALDNEVSEVQEPSGNSEEAAGSVFTPPPPSNWSYTAGNEAPARMETTPVINASESPDDPDWKVPSTWSGVSGDEDEVETDSAGFTDGGDDEVDYLSGDENIEVSGPPAAILPPDDARDKAIALVDELRRTIRMMSSGSGSDHGAAAMALTEASLSVTDFSDVRGLIADVKNDPRDIQALSNLAARIDRLDELLDEHKSLAQKIETALKEING